MKKGIRFYNTIYFRVLVIFGIVFSLFVTITGIVFVKMYSRNIIQDYAEQLITDAKRIADNVEEYSISEENSDYLNYMDAVESILDSQMVDVWIMPYRKADNRLKPKYCNVKMKYKDLSGGMKKVINNACKKDSPVGNQSYDEIYDAEMIRAAAPVHDAGGMISGTVLLNGIAESRVQMINNCKKIVLISMVISWVASFLMALFFAGQISVPISRIRQTAAELAKGKYSVKTGINGSGEVGELGHTIDILSDKLAENEHIRDELEQSRMDFFANVSHELRTPITVIRGYAESLADGYVTDEEKINYSLQRMLKECSGMERLVGDLLTLSKMQNPDFKIEKEPVSVVQIFEDVIRSAKVLSEKKGIVIKFHADDPYCFMLGDYDRLRQMFMVIMDNAIKFSHENSVVEVNIKINEKMYVSIRDHGVGIKEEILPNIFEKFYKSKLRMNEKGSGLGLMIAKGIAIKHGGDIIVKSAEGEGSEFIFEFDMIEPPED